MLTHSWKQGITYTNPRTRKAVNRISWKFSFAKSANTRARNQRQKTNKQRKKFKKKKNSNFSVDKFFLKRENYLLRGAQDFKSTIRASHSFAKTKKSMNLQHNHLQGNKKSPTTKKHQINPTGFGCKQVLKLLPQLWKSHSSASKPSYDHLKAC